MRPRNLTKLGKRFSKNLDGVKIIDLDTEKIFLPIYGVPIEIKRICVFYRPHHYAEIEFLYSGSEEIFEKIEKSARKYSSRFLIRASYVFKVSYYLDQNRESISEILEEIDLGFSTSALNDLARNSQINASIPRDIEGGDSTFSFIRGASCGQPEPLVISELSRAIGLRRSMDEFDS